MSKRQKDPSEFRWSDVVTIVAVTLFLSSTLAVLSANAGGELASTVATVAEALADGVGLSPERSRP